MHDKLTLIQLISEQTIQNLLPMLRLRPKRLVHLVTPKTAPRSSALLSAAKAAGLDPEFESVQLSAMPGIQECFHGTRDVIERSRHDQREAVVNFTGGTKLMSIGAFAAAQSAQAPSLYVDTQDACFVDGATSGELSRLLDGDFSFTPIRRQLRVDVIGIANGVVRITGGKSPAPLLPLADRLFLHPDEEEAVHLALHGKGGLFPEGREPRRAADWLPVLDRMIDLPVAAADLAVQGGLVKAGDRPGRVRLPDATREELRAIAGAPTRDYETRYYKAVAPLQHAAAFLTGGWWELVVFEAARKSGLFRDLRWSAQVGDREGADTEEDILGVDGVELLYINCKRGGSKARLLPLLEEVRARAGSIGGAFNRRFLAVRHFPSGRVAANLTQRARELGIRLISGATVRRDGVFDR